MAVFNTIADSVRTVVAGISGVPAILEVRKDDSLFARESPPAVIITMGDENEEESLSGAGTDTDQGDVLKSYQIGITIYRVNTGDINESMTTNPNFIESVKHALNRKSLAGASTVYDTKLVTHPEWERQAFGKAYEVTRFGILFYSSETRLGN